MPASARSQVRFPSAIPSLSPANRVNYFVLHTSTIKQGCKLLGNAETEQRRRTRFVLRGVLSSDTACRKNEEEYYMKTIKQSH